MPVYRGHATHGESQRVAAAIRSRYAALVEQGLLLCHSSVQDTPTGSPVEVVEDVA